MPAKRCKVCGKMIPRNKGTMLCAYHYVLYWQRKKNARKKI